MTRLIRYTVCLFVLICGSLWSAAQDFRPKTTGHPRLLMTEQDEHAIKAAIKADRRWAMVDSLLIGAANDVMDMPVSQRVVIGRRLLDVSRETLRRTLLLGYAYRISGADRYRERAEEELLAVCRFDDWNPSHFLDVAEMTTAVAIGYDWLYEKLSPAVRDELKQAIKVKGVLPSYDEKYNDWLKKNNNWNQVCNTGMAYGAITIFEDEPQLAQETIRRSVESVKKPMKAYAPDGAYPEGYSYWGFGTTYNVLLLDALERVFGSDMGLSRQQGFLQTPDFMLHNVAPDHHSYNFGDNTDPIRVNPAMFWFAMKRQDNTPLWNERYFLDRADLKKTLNYRFFPLAMIWGAHLRLDNLNTPRERMWTSPASITPVTFMRTNWESDDAIYLAFKGGSASSGHAHMDAGSFIMVADGERWAMDFGRQDYHSLESKGIDLWNRKQNSDRWRVFRYNNLAHNTLTFDGRFQQVDGYARIDTYQDKGDMMRASSDLTAVYAGQVKSAKRGVGIVGERYVVVKDEITTDKRTKIRWTMLTPAHVRKVNPREFQLSQNGKTLRLVVEASRKVELKTWSTAPTTYYDAENPGTILIGFECDVPANKQFESLVKLIPGNTSIGKDNIPPLSQWGNITTQNVKK